MHERKSWFKQLLSADRISLTSPHYFKRIRIFLTCYVLLSLGLIGALLYSLEITLITLTLATAILISILLLIAFCSKKLFSSALKGGTLILRDMKHRNHITSLRSLKKVKSIRFGIFQLTTIQFKLDGIVRSGVIINSDYHIPFNTDRFLLKAIDLYKKQKANL